MPASKRCLEKAGWKPADLDLMEINEAFAAQACAVNKEMGWDTSKINVNGGAIALGHPIGASGCRVLVTLLHEMAPARREEGPRVAVHRRRHGRRARRRALMATTLAASGAARSRRDDRTPVRRNAPWQTSIASRSSTGGMGGLGEAICIKLAALGYTVVTTHSPGNTKAHEWLAVDEEAGLRLPAPIPCDVADCESGRGLREEGRRGGRARSTCSSTTPASRAT